MPFRFLIGPVMINTVEGTMVHLQPFVIVEAQNYNTAAAEAESRWPGEQLFVAKIGRIHNVSAADVLPLTSGAE